MKAGWKNPLMRAINLVLYLSFCALAGTGILLEWRLVPGSEGGRGLRSLGFDRHEWGDLHLWLGLIFCAAAVAHLVLNWAWLKKIAAAKSDWKLYLGLAVGLALVAGTALLPVAGR